VQDRDRVEGLLVSQRIKSRRDLVQKTCIRSWMLAPVAGIPRPPRCAMNTRGFVAQQIVFTTMRSAVSTCARPLRQSVYLAGGFCGVLPNAAGILEYAWLNGFLRPSVRTDRSLFGYAGVKLTVFITLCGKARPDVDPYLSSSTHPRIFLSPRRHNGEIPV